MIIEIEGQEHKLKFGIKFIKQLDKKYTHHTNGTSYGVGLNYLVKNLELRNPVLLAEGIKFAAGISESKAEDYVDSLDEDELEALYVDFLQGLKKVPSTALQIRKAEENEQVAKKLAERLMEQ